MPAASALPARRHGPDRRPDAVRRALAGARQGRAGLPGRPQRLRQVDAAQGARRADRARRRRALPAAAHERRLPAAGAGRSTPTDSALAATLGRPAAGRGRRARPAPRRERCSTRLGDRSRAPRRHAVRRRGAPRRAGPRAGRRARRAAARRADQPPRPADHRAPRAGSRRRFAAASSWSATTAPSSPRSAARSGGSTAASCASSSRASTAFDAWSEALLAEEEAALRRLEKRIAEETDWSHHGITARRKRNQGRLRRLHDAARGARRGASRRPAGQARRGDRPAGGRLVIEAEHVTKRFGERT